MRVSRVRGFGGYGKEVWVSVRMRRLGLRLVDRVWGLRVGVEEGRQKR